MASSQEYVEYVVEQLSLAGLVTWKRMFGEYGLYCDGKFFAVICDDRFLVKITQAGRSLMPECETQLPYPGGSPMFYIQEPDDREFLARLVRATCDELPAPKPKTKKKKEN